MTEFIKILLPYIMGIICAYLIFQPMENWQEGYNTAKEHYQNWNEGFDQGYKSAEKLYKDYHKGFGDGFEAGWDSALDNKGDEE